MTNSDVRVQFEAAAHHWVGTVAALTDEQWRQRALGEWDVRALVGHTLRAFATIDRFLAAAQPAGTIELDSAAQYYRTALADPGIHDDVAARGVDAGSALGDDPAAAVATAVNSTLHALVDAPLDLVGPTVAGSMRLGDYLETRLVELAVHGADLTAALGVDVADLPEVWTRVLGIVSSVASGHNAQVATMSLLGRGPLPVGFNLFG